MLNIDQNVNYVRVEGKIQSSPVFNHVFDDIGYYSMVIEVPRISGKSDFIKVILQEKMLVVNGVLLDFGMLVGVVGSLVQSMKYGYKDVLVLANAVDIIDVPGRGEEGFENTVVFGGCIHQWYPIREVSEGKELKVSIIKNDVGKRPVMLKVVSWGKSAYYMESNYSLEDNIIVKARLESRMKPPKEGYNTEEYIRTHESSLLSILPSNN